MTLHHDYNIFMSEVMSEGGCRGCVYGGRYVGAMVQRYVGQVCRKGLSEGLSGGYVGEWLWVTVERPPPGGTSG